MQSPGRGRAGGQGQRSSGTSPLSWGLQRPAPPHSRLLVPLQAHHCLHGGQGQVRQGPGPPGAQFTPTQSLPEPPTCLLCPFGPPAAEPVCPSHWSGCGSSSKSSNTSPGWVSACQAAGGATPEAGAHLRLWASGRLNRKKGPRSTGGGGGLYHLLDPLETFAVEAEGLFKQHLVLYRPLVRKRGEVGQVSQRLLYVVLMPQEHAQCLAQERGQLRLSCPQHCPVSTPNPCEAKAHLLNVVTMLLLGHRNVLVNCRGGRSQVLEEGLQPLSQACLERGMPPGARPLSLSPRAGAEPTYLSLQPTSEKSWLPAGMNPRPQLPRVCMSPGSHPTHAWHLTHSGWATTPTSPSAPCYCSVRGSLKGNGAEEGRHHQPGGAGLDPRPEGSGGVGPAR